MVSMRSKRHVPRPNKKGHLAIAMTASERQRALGLIAITVNGRLAWTCRLMDKQTRKHHVRRGTED